MERIITTGPGGGVQPRLEINTLVQDDRFFSLYIQALIAMQNTDQEELLSSYQTSGIHGYPFISYDDANSELDHSLPTQWAGYCTHGSTLFPVWHRPYMMLYEQIMWQHAQVIAATYTTPDKDQWVDAALKLRLAYWDWAENSVPPPQVISLDQVEITMPDGQRSSVINPLRGYRFHPMPEDMPPPYKDWPRTLRYPIKSGSEVTDDVSTLIATLSDSQSIITTDTYHMLIRTNNWKEFSNHDPSHGSANSLEKVDGNVHVLTGGAGQMADPTVTGFDPIFFHHHANVDRMLSLWSALHPGVWVSPCNAGCGTWTLPYRAPVDDNTSLTPFRINQSEFWVSTEITNTNALHYTYPEFQGIDTNDPEALKEAIAEKVNQLYGPGSVDPSTSNPLLMMLREIFGGKGGQYSDWTARITFDRTQVGKSFSVIFFFHSVPEDSSTWLTCPQFVGASHAFVPSNQRTRYIETEYVEEGFVSLDPAIAGKTTLESFSAESVVPFLEKELKWRVRTTDNRVINLESLQVEILEVPLSVPPGAHLPTVGNVINWHDITQGRGQR